MQRKCAIYADLEVIDLSFFQPVMTILPRRMRLTHFGSGW
jgi:hypothetical protein